MNKPASQEKKDKKANDIVLVATDLFLQHGIEAIKMTDIAESCLLGVATLYRYFRVKKSIVISTGIVIWEKKEEEFKKLEEDNLINKRDGISSVKVLLYHFLDMYKNDKQFFTYLREFDSFCLSEKVSSDELAHYDEVILRIKDIFLACGKRGKEDKTIRDDIDFSLTYFAFSKALIGLCQKLISEGDILSSDKQEDDTKQVETLLTVLISYFKR